MTAGTTSTARLGRKAACTADQEQELADHVLRLAKLFFGVKLTELRHLEYYFAEKYNFPEVYIYCVDETSMSTVQKSLRILGPKEQKQVGAAISWERGNNVATMFSVSPSGIYIAAILIYPRKRMSTQLQKGSPFGVLYSCFKHW